MWSRADIFVLLNGVALVMQIISLTLLLKILVVLSRKQIGCTEAVRVIRVLACSFMMYLMWYSVARATGLQQTMFVLSVIPHTVSISMLTLILTWLRNSRRCAQ